MIRFGPSGNSTSFYADGYKKTEQAMKWLSEKGLNAYEFSFGRGINISDETASVIAREAQKYNIEISVHAPYYINFANIDDIMAEKSYAYCINSCLKLKSFCGSRVVIHPATVGKATRTEAFDLTLKRFHILVEKIYEQQLNEYYFCPETMGKINQIGTLEEVSEICKIDKCLIPTIDFGHLNARTMGGIKTIDDYRKIIDYLIDNIGYDKTAKMHIHFSKIEYTKGGEVRHLTFDDTTYGPEFAPLSEIIAEYKLQPVIICESDGTQAEDSVSMLNLYNNIKEGE